MKAKKFDSDFDAGKDVSHVLDLSEARRPLQEQKRVNVDFPVWMIESLDKKANRLGVTRQYIIQSGWLSVLKQSLFNKLHALQEAPQTSTWL